MKIVILGLAPSFHSDLYFKALQSLLPGHQLFHFIPSISLNAYDGLVLVGDDHEQLFSNLSSSSSTDSLDFLDILPQLNHSNSKLIDDLSDIEHAPDSSVSNRENSEINKKNHWLIEEISKFKNTKIVISNTINDICAEYLGHFDHFFIADKSLLLRMQRRYGSQYVHYLPDIRFKNNIVVDRPDNKIIGIFADIEIEGLKYPSKIIKDINKILYKKITYGICFDIDTIIVCIISLIPFIAIGEETRIFCDNLQYWGWLPAFDNDVIERLEAEPVDSLLQKLQEFRFLLETNQINALFEQKSKRVPFVDLVERINFEQLANEEQFLALETQSELSQFISQLCFDLTNIPISKYIPLLHKKLILGDLASFNDNLLAIVGDFINETLVYANRLNLSYLHQLPFVDIHRSGWNYVCSYFQSLHCPNGVLFDTYVEQTFQRAAPVLAASGIIPYSSPWIGILHYTFNSDYTQYSLGNLFVQPLFLKSLPTCFGFICLSEYLSQQIYAKLEQLNYDIPVLTLYHPTAFPSATFSLDKFLNNSNKRIISIGLWYRNPLAIYLIQTPLFRKTLFQNSGMESYIPPASFTISRPHAPSNSRWLSALYRYLSDTNYCFDLFGSLPSKFSFEISAKANKKRPKTNLQKFKRYIEQMIKSVEIMPKVDNNTYDALLTENIVFLNLVDASASNTIIECIVRNTPIIVNRLPACEEYLGKDYPLFYDNYEQVSSLATVEKITEAHIYLKNRDKEFLRIETMISTLKQSKMYTNLICLI